VVAGVFPPRLTFEFNIREKDDRKMGGRGVRTSFSGTLPLESNFLQFKLKKNKEASLISA